MKQKFFLVLAIDGGEPPKFRERVGRWTTPCRNSIWRESAVEWLAKARELAAKQGFEIGDRFESAKATIARMKALTAEEWQREYGHCKGTRPEVIKRYEKSHAEETRKRARALKRAAKARALFDSLNGSAAWKDAKLDWQDDYDE